MLTEPRSRSWTPRLVAVACLGLAFLANLLIVGRVAAASRGAAAAAQVASAPVETASDVRTPVLVIALVVALIGIVLLVRGRTAAAFSDDDASGREAPHELLSTDPLLTALLDSAARASRVEPSESTAPVWVRRLDDHKKARPATDGPVAQREPIDRVSA